MARRLDEVEKNLRQSPTPNVEQDLRCQIDDLRSSESQLIQHLDMLTAKNTHLHEELDNASHELGLKSKELCDLREETDRQRRDAEANDTRLRALLDDSVQRERLLKAKLDQAVVREKLLRQEVRQAVQDERTQLTNLTGDGSIMLTPTPSAQTGVFVYT